jgi:hypothetical protein
MESHSICTAHLLKRKSPGFFLPERFQVYNTDRLNFLQYYYATEDNILVEICRIVNKHLVESVPCWFYGLIILQEQFYAKRKSPRATPGFHIWDGN